VRKEDFDHVIAVAASVTGEDEIVVIGSQAILGSVADPPAEMARSLEADVYPRAAPAKAEEIDGALGDGSGRGRSRRRPLPRGARPRARQVRRGSRPDWEFAEVALREQIVEFARLLGAVDDMPIDPSRRAHVTAMLQGIGARLQTP
jgi:hypothetical protein